MKDEESHPCSSFHSSDAEMQKEPDGWEEIDDNGAPELNSVPTTDGRTGERGTRAQKEGGEEKVETSTGESSVTTVATLTAKISQLNLTDQNKNRKCKKKSKKPKAGSDGEGSNDGKSGIDATSKSQSTGTVADGQSQSISKEKPTVATDSVAVSESPPNPTDDAAASGTSTISANKGKPSSPFSLKLNLMVVALLAVFGQMQGVSGLLTTLPANVLAKSGAEVRLRCSTSLTDPVYWLRRLHGASETQTLYYGSLGFASLVNGRFKIDRSRDKGSYDVIIRNVTTKDAGVYVCQDDGGMGERKEMQLIVFEYFNCTMPTPPVGFMGQNDIADDEIRASCSLKYHGNQKPRFQWRWSHNSMVDSTEEDSESTTVVSKVMTQPRQELNGTKLTCTASVSVSDGSDAQDSSATVQWTSHQVTVLHASLQPGNMEQCKGSSLILVCNSECEYLETQLNYGLCQCSAIYQRSEDEQRELAFSVYSCVADGASWKPFTLIILIAIGVAVVMAAIPVIVVIIRKCKGSRKQEVKEKQPVGLLNGSPKSIQKSIDSSESSGGSGTSLIDITVHSTKWCD